MGKAYVCGMCGCPILETGHVEGYNDRKGTWEPLHGRCAEVIRKTARRIGWEEPAMRDGFADIDGKPVGVTLRAGGRR